MPNHVQVVGLCSFDFSSGKDPEDFDFYKLNNSNLCELALPLPQGENDVHQAREVWGTKWGAYGTEVGELEGDGFPFLVRFQSAWCPPNEKCMEKIEDFLSEKYMLKNFVWLFHDPFDGSVETL